MISSIDYQVQLLNFHNGKIHESVVSNEDGSYTIFIDAALSKEGQQNAFLHAMMHICHRDFDKKCSTDLLEIRAHSA